MVTTCVVKSCKSKQGSPSDVGVTFHAFPRYLKERQIWLDNLQIKNKDGTPWVPYPGAKVCSKHFSAACFKQESDKKEKLVRRILFSDAFPTKALGVAYRFLPHRSYNASQSSIGKDTVPDPSKPLARTSGELFDNTENIYQIVKR